MSRWDALKPDATASRSSRNSSAQNGRFSQGTGKHTQTHRQTKHNQNNNRENDFDSQAKNNNQRRHRPRPVIGTFVVVQDRVEKSPKETLEKLLLEFGQSTAVHDNDARTKTTLVQELATLLESPKTMISLAKEDTSNLLEESVGEMLLPFLLEVVSIVHDDSATSVEEDPRRNRIMKVLLSSMKAFTQMFQYSYSTTRLIAPLVVEVNEVTGREILAPNPHRQHIYSVLQTLLSSFVSNNNTTATSLTSNLQVHTGFALIALLDAARSVEGTSKHAQGKSLDVDPRILYEYFQYTFRKQQHARADAIVTSTPHLLREKSLELFMALLKRHPSTSSQLMPLLVMPQNTDLRSSMISHRIKSTTRTRSDARGQPTFVSLIQSESTSSKIYALLCQVGNLLLHGVSQHQWQQWLGGLNSTTNAKAPGNLERRNGTLSFQDRMEAGMCSWIDSLRYSIQNKGILFVPKDALVLSCTLLRKLSSFAVSGDLRESGKLTAALLLQQYLNSLAGARQREASPSSTSLQIILQALEIACGGSETPDGQFLAMVLPFQHFLASAEGSGWLSRCMTVATGNKDAMRLLCMILRTHPEPWLRSESLWEKLLSLSTTDESNQLNGIQILNVFLQGRAQFADGSDYYVSPKVIVDELSDKLLASLSSSSSDSFGSNAYGFLTTLDWEELIQRKAAILHISALVQLSQTASSKLQKSVYKALGDVCTNFFGCPSVLKGSEVTTAKKICELTSQALLSSLRRSDEPAVLSMSLSAVGNLARALKDHHDLLLEADTLKDFATLSLAFCKQRTIDSKVRSIAIRGIGHLVCLIFSNDRKDMSYLRFIDGWTFLQKSLDCLIRTIQQTISLALQESSSSLSWKERSTIKKLGWGACHSLSLILSVVQSIAYKVNDACLAFIRTSVQVLLNCVQNADKVHDKVTLVAISTLCSLDLSTSRMAPSLAGDCQFHLSEIICQLLKWVCDSKNGEDGVRFSQRSLIQLQELLVHLLSCCSVADAEDILLLTLPQDGHLQFLYDWLIKQKEGSNKLKAQMAFDTLVLSMSKRSDLLAGVDIQLELQFAAQAKDVAVLDASETGEYSGEATEDEL